MRVISEIKMVIVFQEVVRVQLQTEGRLLEEWQQEIWIRGLPKQEQMGSGKRAVQSRKGPGEIWKKTAGAPSVERAA